MSKPRQTTLFQSWKGSGSKPPSQIPPRPSAGSSIRPSTSTAHSNDGFGDDDEDEDLLLAMQLSLQEAQPQRTPLHNVQNVHGVTGAHNASSSRSTGSTLFSSVHGNKSLQQKKPTLTLTEPTMLSASHSKPKVCTPSNLGLFKMIGSKQGTLQKYSDREPEQLHHEGVRIEEEEPEELTEEQLAALEDIPGFDKGAGQMWIYPTNYSVREYQFNIVKAALYTNTLVVLPTGLGKTFIAAVVMYNFYRWYPRGKVVFMAPTKPLVAQQIEACYNIMGIPQLDAAEMTGAMQPSERKLAWHKRRVFFLTPQVLTNDLSREACPATLVKCLVIDEAHKALGNHAYCQVVKELAKYDGEFRVLALSATPGSDMKAVQQVISNLMIAHVELRSEESPDIKQYTHERRVEKVVIPLGQELTAVKEKYLRVMTVVVNRLKRLGVIYNREVTSLSKFLVLKAREAFRQNPPHNLPHHQFGVVEGDFALAMSLYHGYDLLQQHGLRSLQSYLLSLISGEKGHGRTRAELLRNNDFTDLMEMIKKFAPVKAALPCTQQSQSASQLTKPFEVGHPKMAKLQEIALEHFTNFQGGENNSATVSTRVMVFAQYRDSVSEITEMLNRHRPLIKCMSFIGQSSAGKATKGFTQKEQLKVMKQFREGGYNMLVSTCVGEEGLDIGDVDLIICFDAHKSPIRLVQRMGRTGRKREGRIIMLVTAGKEEQIYNQSQYTKRSIHKAIQNGAKSLIFYPNSSRMVPDGLNPRCHRMYITVKETFVPRTKAGKAAKEIKPPARASGAKTKAARKPVEDGFLKPEELRHWNQHYRLKDNEVPKLPPSTFVTLKQPATVDRPVQEMGPQLSLNAWMPWQNRLQETVFVGHSMQSRHLVDLVEFMQIQSTIGGDDDDPYHLEMETYLNKEDINVKTSKPQGIMRFCTPSGANGEGKITEKASSSVVGTEFSKPRRSKNLPSFSSDEERLPGESSDEDLPVFDGAKTTGTIKLTKKSKEDDHIAGDTVNMLSSDEGDVITLDRDDVDHGRITHDPVDLNPPVPPVSKKGKGNGKKSVGLKAPEQQKKDLEVQRKTKKKRRSSDKVNISVVPLIEDPADDDFEGVTNTTTTKAAQEPKPGTIISAFNKSNVRKEPAKLPKRDEEVPDVVMVSDSDEEVVPVHCDAPPIDDPLPATPSLSQMLPLLTPHKEYIAKDIQPDAHIDPDDKSGLYRVRTPPAVEELESALMDLESRDRLSPVDMVALIDKWEQEKMDVPKDISHLTAKEASSFPKCSIVTTPIKINSCVTKPIVQSEANSDLDEVQDLMANDHMDDLFFDGSLLMGEPTSQHRDRVSEKDQCSKSNKESVVTKSTEFIFGQPVDISKLSNVSSSPSSSPSKDHPLPETPFMPRSKTGSIFTSNTSTPMCVELQQKTKRLSLGTDKGEHQRKLSVSKDTRRKSDPWSTPSSIRKPPKDQTRAASVSPLHDSFFSDLNNDSAFAAIETPTFPMEPVSKVQDGTQNTGSHKVMFALPESTPKQIPAAKVTPLNPHDVSQLTFTQAMACVNDSSDTMSEANSSRSLSPKPLSPGNRPPSSTSLENRKIDDKSRSTSPHSNIHVQTEAEKDQTPVENNVVDEEADAQFDLGFDFDEFDEDMVVPPSPTSQGFSVSRRQSQTTELRTDSVSAAHKTTLLQEPSRTNNVDDRQDREQTRPKVIEESRTGTLLQAAVSKDTSQQKFTFTKRQPMRSLSTKTNQALQQKATVAPEKPKPVESVPQLSDSIAAMFAYDSSDDLFCDDEDDWQPQQVTPKKDAVDKPAPEIAKVSPMVPTFKTPVRPAPKASRPKVADVNSIVDSPILPPQKRNRKALIIDDEDDADSPIAPPKKRRRSLRMDSDDDSPVVVVKTKKRAHAVIDITQMDDEDDDDDFISAAKPSRNSISSTKNFTKLQNKKKDAPNPKKTSRGVDFLEMEAERSEDDCSEDEYDGEEDHYEMSFVNDCTQMSQEDRGDDVDMRAVYLRSVRSPVRSGGCYRLAKPKNNDMDIFSQVPVQDSEYDLEDSFVHDGDESEEEEADTLGEVSLMDLGLNVTMSRQTRRQARVAAAKRMAVQPPRKPKPKTGRRVVRVLDSSSDEEGDRIEPSQTTGKAALKQKPQCLSTSSSSPSSSPNRMQSSNDEAAGTGNTKHTHSITNESIDISPTGITQLTGLRKRIMQKLNPGKSSSSTSDEAKRTERAGSHAVLSAAGAPSLIQYHGVKNHEDPTFSLGMDLLDDNWDDDDDDESIISKPDLPPQCAQKSNTSVSHLRSASSAITRIESSACREEPIPSSQSSAMSAKERRIMLARQRQEEFRKKMAASKSSTVTGVSASSSRFGTQIYPPSQSPKVQVNRHAEPTPTPPPAKSTLDTSLVTPERSKQKGRLTMIIDSREINGARELISILKFKHNVGTVIRQLLACDFIISNRMAVDRILHSTFTNSSKKARLVDQMRRMCELYDRPVIIVERDPVKPDQKPPRPHPNTKYTDSIMAALAQTHIKLIYSDSQEQTAGLMFELASQEEKKQQGITVSTELSNQREQMLRYYMSIPRVSYIVALNLVHGFRTITDMMRSSQTQLQRIAGMSPARATGIRNHLSRKFDIQLLGIRS